MLPQSCPTRAHRFEIRPELGGFRPSWANAWQTLAKLRHTHRASFAKCWPSLARVTCDQRRLNKSATLGQSRSSLVKPCHKLAKPWRRNRSESRIPQQVLENLRARRGQLSGARGEQLSGPSGASRKTCEDRTWLAERGCNVEDLGRDPGSTLLGALKRSIRVAGSMPEVGLARGASTRSKLGVAPNPMPPARSLARKAVSRFPGTPPRSASSKKEP